MKNKGYKKSATGTERKSSKKRKAASGIYRLDNGPAELEIKPIAPPTYAAGSTERTRTMTTTIGPNEEHEINKLHYEVRNEASAAIFGAMKIGELLTERKKQLPPDEWFPWLMNNVKFDERMAANYIASFECADLFELAAFDDLAVTCQSVCFGFQPSAVIDDNEIFLE
jgi:hypothetical protein